MAAWRLGELAGAKASHDVRPELSRCVGQHLLSQAPLAFGAPGPRRRVFDLFPYSGESMVLSIKLHEMASWVDRFVIVEARTSFTGEPKPLRFEAQRDAFAAFADKISYVVVDAFPGWLNSAWSREFFQRDSAVQGLSGLAAPDDIVLLTDVDEIVEPRAIEGFESEIRPVRLRFFQYFLNCEQVLRERGPQTLAVKARHLAGNGASYLRMWVRDRISGDELQDAGWHFSSVGDPGTLERKMKSFSHQEYAGLDSAHFERLFRAIRDGENPAAYARREVDDSFPAYVRDNRDALADYLW
jgi:beta-1,4-mannosyl-glycoprotein beta-1,4-N-acetylglucosaminyltransferase